MNAGRKITENLLPWSGIIGAGLGWALSQQIGTTAIQDNCALGDWLFVSLLGLLGLVLAVTGGLLSFKLWRRGEKETQARRFLALLGMMIAATLSFPILLHTAAVFIIPRCLG